MATDEKFEDDSFGCDSSLYPELHSRRNFSTVKKAAPTHAAVFLKDENNFDTVISMYLVHTDWDYIEAKLNIQKKTLRQAIFGTKRHKEMFISRIKDGSIDLIFESLPKAVRAIERVLVADYSEGEDSHRIALAAVKSLGDILTKLQPPKSEKESDDDIDKLFREMSASNE